MKFKRARFVGIFLALLGTGFCLLNVSGQSAESAKIPAVPAESEAWEGRLADGTPLTRKKLDEMLAAHQEWGETFYKIFARESIKAIVKGEDPKKWAEKLLASDWGADQGRLVLRGADLEEANLQKAKLWNANLQGAKLGYANLQGVLYEPDPGTLPDIVRLRSASHLKP